MSDKIQDGVLADIPEPGVFSGICTLLGGLLGVFLVGSLYLYGPADGPVVGSHLGLVIPLGALFAFLLAAFTFLLGWIIETVWPLIGMLVFVTLLLLAPLLFYFGFDNFMSGLASLKF